METYQIIAIIIVLFVLFILAFIRGAGKLNDEYDKDMESMPTYPNDAEYLADMRRKMEAIEQPQQKPTEVPAKRTHKSRKASFSLDKAIADGMAVLVSGKSHVYVGIKESHKDGYFHIRGISNGMYYGFTNKDMNGKRWFGVVPKIDLGYLINIRK